MSTLNSLELSPKAVADLPPPTDARITRVRHLASYNWIEAATPTIAVPGCPAAWSNIDRPTAVCKDSGRVIIAQNVVRHPDSPLEPLFRALEVEQSNLETDLVDLVSDRNNIRKLLQFVALPSTDNQKKNFTIKAEKIGNTVAFQCEDDKIEDFIAPHECRGYGREFEKRCTIEQIEKSTGHHRITGYKFGGLELVIRYELDGFDPELNDMIPTSADEDISDPEINHTASGSKLTVRKSGRIVSQASTLEIKTRAQHKQIQLDEVGAQLWISQTPNLVRAYHNRGHFDVPRVKNVRAEIHRWESRNQNNLKLLAALLTKIIEFVRAHDQVLLQYRARCDSLLLKPVLSNRMLPEDLYLAWSNDDTHDAEFVEEEVEEGEILQ